jgi:hypothetical protein
MKGTLHEDMCTFTIASRWNILRTKNISDKICTENPSNKVTFSVNHAVY